MSMRRVGTQADVTRHQQLREQGADLLHRQDGRRVVCVRAGTSLVLTGTRQEAKKGFVCLSECDRTTDTAETETRVCLD